jgi:hypothetical protein
MHKVHLCEEYANDHNDNYLMSSCKEIMDHVAKHYTDPEDSLEVSYLIRSFLSPVLALIPESSQIEVLTYPCILTRVVDKKHIWITSNCA